MNIYVYTRLLLVGGILMATYGLAVVAFMAPYILVFVVVVIVAAKLQKKGRPTTSHGSARLADLADLQTAKMIGGEGLCVGYVTKGGA